MKGNNEKKENFVVNLIFSILLFIVAIAFLVWTIICIRETIETYNNSSKQNTISVLVTLLGWAPVLGAGTLGVKQAGKAISYYNAKKYAEMQKNSIPMTEQEFREFFSKEFDAYTKMVDSIIAIHRDYLFESEYQQVGGYGKKEVNEHRDDIIFYKVCAQAVTQGTDFDKEKTAKKQSCFNPYSVIALLIIFRLIGSAIIGVILSLIFREYAIWCYIGSAVLFALSIVISVKKFRKTREKALRLKEECKEYLSAVNFAEAVFESPENPEVANRMLSCEKDAVYRHQKLQREIEHIKAQISGIATRHMRGLTSSASSTVSAGTSGSSSTVSSGTSSSSTAQNPNARREITDEAGRVQGYTENGRIYNNENDVVGHIEGNRVYDKDFNRVGEVGSDGKITKYK